MNRETRDDFLDATRGSFLSHGLQYAPAGIGSDIQFLRYYGQFFKYVPLSRPAEAPLSGGMMRPRWVYAGAARVGLARGLGGQQLIRTERFFAGGGTTLRGFAQNTLGPTDFFGDPAGGNAVVLLNQELRFPAYGIFDGAGFVDVGNVFPTVRDFSLGNLRKTMGAGLRIRTPYFLIRLDYGFKLDRRPGERLGSFFFSIGQAF
jgi:outer membrane protein insertion porin family